MKKTIVILDSETTYARRLSDYILTKYSSEYDVRMYTTESIFTEAMNNKSIDLLIVDESIYRTLTANAIYRNIKVYKEVVLSADEGSTYIFKYQSAERILAAEIGSFSNKQNTDKVDVLRDMKLSIKTLAQEKLLVTGKQNDNDTLKIIDECIDNKTENRNEKLSDIERNHLRNSVFYSIRGLDILEELLADDSISEIMVNGENSIFIERDGHLLNTNKCFDSKEQLLDIIQKIVSSANRIVNMSSPIVDARLSNGSRINVVLEPVSIDGPTLTIRRFPESPLTSERLIQIGAVTEEIMADLRRFVSAGYNILVSGSTGSGKTTPDKSTQFSDGKSRYRVTKCL